MKKLTAGIFAGILTIVTVNAARADIATTNYVNQNVNAKVGTLTELTTTAKGNAVAAINEVNQAAKDAAAAATAAETNAIDAANQNTAGLLGTGVSTTNTVTKQFETINAKVKTNADAITDITKADGTIDTKIKAAQNTLQGNINGKVDVKTDLAKKLLTTDATSGQLVSATATVAKPTKCTAEGAQCMLIDKGTGLEWELIVDTYSAK